MLHVALSEHVKVVKKYLSEKVKEKMSRSKHLIVKWQPFLYKGDKLGDKLYGLSLGDSVATDRHA